MPFHLNYKSYFHIPRTSAYAFIKKIPETSSNLNPDEKALMPHNKKLSSVFNKSVHFLSIK